MVVRCPPPPRAARLRVAVRQSGGGQLVAGGAVQRVAAAAVAQRGLDVLLANAEINSSTNIIIPKIILKFPKG